MSTDTGDTRTDGRRSAPAPRNGDGPTTAAPAPAVPEAAPTLPTRALGGLTHGGRIIGDEAFDAEADAAGRADVSRASDVLGDPEAEGTPFGYLFPDLADRWPLDHLPVDDPGAVVAGLQALGSAMIEGDVPAPGDAAGTNSTVPPIYTYWGQFIDHDITANTDRDDDLSIVERPLRPRSPAFVADRLRNLRDPALNLDSLYGDGPHGVGPDRVPYVGGTRLELGVLTALGLQGRPVGRIPAVPGGPDPDRDVKRKADRTPLIGDGRNDENLIVSQLHVAFLHAHNNVVGLVQAATPGSDADTQFAEARRLLRWTYQWLVRHDFLTTLVDADTIAAVEADPRYAPSTRGVHMPLEFSVAAFRFGHSMVRAGYDWNRNFGRAGTDPRDDGAATFEELFQFTGKGGFRDNPTLPDNWPAEWDRLTADPANPPRPDRVATADPGFPNRSTRRIDTRLALPLDRMLNEGTDRNTAVRVQQLLKRLAVRNLLRGYKLAVPTGQAVARALGEPPLSASELLDGENRLVGHVLRDNGFLESTPLWFYVLKEAERHGEGNRLGPVGGRIVAETLIGQLRHDPGSYLASDQAAEAVWAPDQQGNPTGRTTLVDLGGPAVLGIEDLLRFAKVL